MFNSLFNKTTNMRQFIATLVFLNFVITVHAQQLPEATESNGVVSNNSTQRAADGLIRHRVVMHMSSPDTMVWKGLMNNLKNMKTGWGDSVAIEVVVHGPGISMLVKEKTTQAAKIAAFSQQGVRFVACENTIRERKIDRASILPDAGFVPMGVGELVLKQEQGWSYMKVDF